MTSAKSPHEELEALVGKPILYRFQFDASASRKQKVKDWLIQSGWDPSHEFTDDILWYWAPCALETEYMVDHEQE